MTSVRDKTYWWHFRVWWTCSKRLREILSWFYVSKIIQISWFLTKLFNAYGGRLYWGTAYSLTTATARLRRVLIGVTPEVDFIQIRLVLCEKRLSVGWSKWCRTTAQGLPYFDSKRFAEIWTESHQMKRKTQTGCRLKSANIDKKLAVIRKLVLYVCFCTNFVYKLHLFFNATYRLVITHHIIGPNTN